MIELIRCAVEFSWDFHDIIEKQLNESTDDDEYIEVKISDAQALYKKHFLDDAPEQGLVLLMQILVKIRIGSDCNSETILQSAHDVVHFVESVNKANEILGVKPS